MAIPTENSKQTVASVIGATPEGAADREQAARKVREMFTAIAPRYDVLNHMLSMQVDRLWWWRASRTFRHILRRSDSTVLDLCCGTGDMTSALLSRARQSHATPKIVGADFSHAMLQRATIKSLNTPLRWMEADALSLPVGAASFDLVTSAFGFRNLADYDAGLREIFRVLKPGGEIGILDFGEPKGIVGWFYRLYFRYVLPAIGTVISGIEGPYKYLPASVARFPAPEQMLERMRAAGFSEVSWTPYTFGIAGLYRGKK
jgi:demethylmenaquinone methyltransferase / 2-methoxy-6-polyprenyl-1,4-benzoquinol methylase